MIKAIIIDDEKNARKMLNWAVENHCPGVEIIASCSSGKEGKEQINKLKPALVFLDIQMRDMSGFDLLEKMEKIDFEIIFTTAFDRYALNAFKVNAVDYLMKPIDENDLQLAIEKVRQNIENKRSSDQVSFLLERVRKLDKSNDSIIALPSLSGLEFIDTQSILYCRSDSNYTHFYFRDAKPMIVSKTLKTIENLLPENTFFRVHNSYIVNLNHVKRYLKSKGGYLIMANGDEVRISRSKKEDLLELF